MHKAFTDEYTLAAMPTGTYKMLAALLQGATDAEPNAPAPTTVRLVGSTSIVNAPHPSNTAAPSDAKLVDSDTDDSPEQPWNALSLTLVTLLGSVTDTRPTQPANAFGDTLCELVLISTAPEQQAADGELLLTQPVIEVRKKKERKRWVSGSYEGGDSRRNMVGQGEER